MDFQGSPLKSTRLATVIPDSASRHASDPETQARMASLNKAPHTEEDIAYKMIQI